MCPVGDDAVHMLVVVLAWASSVHGSTATCMVLAQLWKALCSVDLNCVVICLPFFICRMHQP
jgi:hypothetical protein